MIISLTLFLLASRWFFVRSELIHIPCNLTWNNKTAYSVDLQWELRTDRKFDDFYDESYTQHILYRRILHNSSDRSIDNSWIDHPIFVSAIDTYPVPEVQEITTVVDRDSSITSGHFWLQLVRDPYYQTESSTLSRPIEFNATAEAFEEAIRKIDGLNKIRVDRYEPGKFETSVHDDRGTYSWRVEFMYINGSAPLFVVYMETLDGKLSDGHGRVKVRRILKGRPIQLKSHMTTSIEGLQPSTFYEFRVNFRYLTGQDMWSNALELKMEDPPLVTYPPSAFIPSELQIRSKYVKRMSGKGRLAGNERDDDYVNGTGVGGRDSENGKDGLVVIISHTRNGIILPSRTTFFYTGSTQYFHVDDTLDSTVSNSPQIDFIDVKLWGGGGAGGGTPKNISVADETGFSHGGGGGFTQTRIDVTPGETLLIQVGSGGKYSPLDLQSNHLLGFQRGGAGGTSKMGRHAGSGGGYSAIYKSSGTLVAMAGGGGGGGATDTCCSHGGAGSGGLKGEDGFSPDAETHHINHVVEKEAHCIDIFSNETCYVDANGCIDYDDKGYVSHCTLDEALTEFTCFAGKGGENPTAQDDKFSGINAESIGIQGLGGIKGGGGGGSGFTRGTGGGGGYGAYRTSFDQSSKFF